MFSHILTDGVATFAIIIKRYPGQLSPRGLRAASATNSLWRFAWSNVDDSWKARFLLPAVVDLGSFSTSKGHASTILHVQCEVCTEVFRDREREINIWAILAEGPGEEIYSSLLYQVEGRSLATLWAGTALAKSNACQRETKKKMVVQILLQGVARCHWRQS